MADQIGLEEGDPLNVDFADNIPTGKKVLGLLYTVTGETASGEALAASDLGRASIDLYGKQRINAPLGFFHYWGREHEGTLEQTLPTAGVTRLTAFLPFYYAEEPNALPVQTVKDVQYALEHEKGTLGTRFNTSAETPTATLRALYTDRIPFRYVPEVEKSSLQFSGQGTQTLELNRSNVTHLYVRAAPGDGGIIDRVDVQKDGKRVTARGVGLGDIKDASVVTANVETPQGPWAHVSLMEGAPQDQGYENTSTDVEVTVNGSGAVDIVSQRRIPRSQA